MNDSCDVAIATHTIDMISAAAATTGPTRCSPSAVENETGCAADILISPAINR